MANQQGSQFKKSRSQLPLWVWIVGVVFGLMMLSSIVGVLKSIFTSTFILVIVCAVCYYFFIRPSMRKRGK